MKNHILIVEDDEAIREGVRILLREKVILCRRQKMDSSV